MPPASPPSTDDLRGDLHRCRRRFQEMVEPLRPVLWRHCRMLTGDPWDAEDLVQDTLLRAFAWLSRRFAEPPALRAWLLRIATNRWIDQCRTPTLEVQEAGEEPAAPTAADPVAMHEAATVLLTLPPRERAAVALIDGLGLTAAEAASCLTTSEGATRSALHRGRARLRQALPEPAVPRRHRAVDAQAVAAFCRAFNARDLPALRELLLPHACADVIGLVREDDRDGILNGSLSHTVIEQGHPLAETVMIDNEAMVLVTYMDGAKSRVAGDILRFTTVDARIVAFRYYYFCPELLQEIGTRIGRVFSNNGYWM